MTCNGRRKFLRTSIAAAAAVPVASALNRAGLGPIVGAQLAHADVTTALSLDHPQAKALGYQHDASKVDTAQFPKRAGAEGA
ncbi:MAG: hypothetical protein KDD70_18625, partial [Bdellovibrionales bacterium]|nr:hypothetical protein [Bdellovibrionales bacterium]